VNGNDQSDVQIRLRDLQTAQLKTHDAVVRMQTLLVERCETRACQINKLEEGMTELRKEHESLKSRFLWLAGAVAASVALLKDAVKRLI
jgi:hypothetical protein